jgi:hypothetical protein
MLLQNHTETDRHYGTTRCLAADQSPLVVLSEAEVAAAAGTTVQPTVNRPLLPESCMSHDTPH